MFSCRVVFESIASKREKSKVKASFRVNTKSGFKEAIFL